MKKLDIYTDGASRGNPGPAAWAFIIVDKTELIHKNSGFLGKSTNNTAEYNAILMALQEAQNWTKGLVKLYSDSQLVIRQLNGEYRVNKAHLLELFNKVQALCNQFEKVEFYHVGRDNRYVQICDSLCNKCLNENR